MAQDFKDRAVLHDGIALDERVVVPHEDVTQHWFVNRPHEGEEPEEPQPQACSTGHLVSASRRDDAQRTVRERVPFGHVERSVS